MLYAVAIVGPETRSIPSPLTATSLFCCWDKADGDGKGLIVAAANAPSCARRSSSLSFVERHHKSGQPAESKLQKGNVGSAGKACMHLSIGTRPYSGEPNLSITDDPMMGHPNVR